MNSGASDNRLEATLTIGAGVVAAGLAAVTAVPLVAVAGQATHRWATTDLLRTLDSAAYGALLGVAVGLAFVLAQRTRPEEHRAVQHPAVTLAAPALSGAAVCAATAAISAWLRIEDASMNAVALHLASSIAFGAAIGGATRLRDPSNRGCAVIGGAAGGFSVWLFISALPGTVSVTAELAIWREPLEAARLGTRILGSSVAAALPALAVPLGVTVADALARIWRR